MALISDKSQFKKLKNFNINIKTKYIVGNNILERNTDNSYNDDIKNGIRCEKLYYLDNKFVHSEKIFDSRIEYTFISNNQDNKEYTCPNCGMKGKVKEFSDGCPYCRTYYNIDYTEKGFFWIDEELSNCYQNKGNYIIINTLKEKAKIKIEKDYLSDQEKNAISLMDKATFITGYAEFNIENR